MESSRPIKRPYLATDCMNIREMNNVQAPQMCDCENCGRRTICYLVGSITPISRRLAYEEWLCTKCIEDKDI